MFLSRGDEGRGMMEVGKKPGVTGKKAKSVKSQPHSHRFRNPTAAWFITDDSHHHHPVTQSAAGNLL